MRSTSCSRTSTCRRRCKPSCPPDYKGLSGPAAAGLRQASYQIVDQALEQPVFQDLFRVALRGVPHDAQSRSSKGAVAAFRQRGRGNAEPAGDHPRGRRPHRHRRPDRGQDPGRRGATSSLLRSDQLDAARNVFQLLKTLAWFLPILTLLAFGLAVWLARDRRQCRTRDRRRTLVVVGLVGLVGRKADAQLRRRLARRSPATTAQAAGDAWDILTELMRGSFRLMFVVGLLFLVAAWLAGPGRRALTARGWLAPGAVQPRLGVWRARRPRAGPALHRRGDRLHTARSSSPSSSRWERPGSS